MDDDGEAFEFAYALYLARKVDRDAAQMIVEAAEARSIGIEEATEALARLAFDPKGPHHRRQRMASARNAHPKKKTDEAYDSMTYYQSNILMSMPNDQ